MDFDTGEGIEMLGDDDFGEVVPYTPNQPPARGPFLGWSVIGQPRHSRLPSAGGTHGMTVRSLRSIWYVRKLWDTGCLSALRIVQYLGCSTWV